MALFVCDVCGCVDNTALGHYWAKNMVQMEGYPLGTALCSECMPLRYASGKSVDVDSLCTPGKWHGKFKKEKWDGKRHVVNREVKPS